MRVFCYMFFAIFIPLRRSFSLLHLLNTMTVCAKVGWNWLSGYGEEDLCNICQCIFSNSFISFIAWRDIYSLMRLSWFFSLKKKPLCHIWVKLLYVSHLPAFEKKNESPITFPNDTVLLGLAETGPAFFFNRCKP